jgi:undecaprenyl diphosphate synthase
VLSRHTALAFAPDPDLFIRTGGEMRISNFLLWQAAYSELLLHRLPVARLRAAGSGRGPAAYAWADRRFGGVTRLEAAPAGG